jgi:acyl-protein synthetase LuxE
MTVTQQSAQSVSRFMDDPIDFFDESLTKMHSIPRDELENLQRQAMAIRFQQHRNGIEIVRKLADRLGITELNEFNDVVPLMFSHTAFKSYPAALIDNKRFDLMTRWLDKLTIHDLSRVDTAGCSSIDEWIDRLDEQTPLEVITSSGTTGTLSIIPKDKHGATEGMILWKICLFQTFGKEPTEEELNPAVEVIWPNYASGKLGHLRIAAMIKKGFTGGDENKFHALYPDAIDTDLMFLASKMRAAASRGELDRLVIDPALAARKDEFIAMQARQPEELNAFFTKIAEKLRGRRVFMIGTYNLMHDVAKAGLERGIENVFAKDSAILTGGGTKGFVLPDNYMDVIREFLGVDRIQEGYGFSEQSAFHWGCSERRYHVQPWVIPFVLDPETSQPLPRIGVQTGRAAVYDVLLKSHWGGVISGDEVTIDWDLKCPCGQTSVAFEHDIIRYSEKQGVDDDRITCAATHEVHNEAVNFMKELES